LRGGPSTAPFALATSSGSSGGIRTKPPGPSGALTLLFGVDPIVALADNSDIPRKRIPDVLAWTARGLVESALAEA